MGCVLPFAVFLRRFGRQLGRLVAFLLVCCTFVKKVVKHVDKKRAIEAPPGLLLRFPARVVRAQIYSFCLRVYNMFAYDVKKTPCFTHPPEIEADFWRVCCFLVVS